MASGLGDKPSPGNTRISPAAAGNASDIQKSKYDLFLWTEQNMMASP
jgi:hypothetical protein